MNSAIQAKVDLPNGAVGPDIWYEDSGMRLPGNFVISRGHDGQTVSRREDLNWDWSPYHPQRKRVGLSFAYWWKRSEKSKITFIPLERKALVEDIQHLMTLILYKRQGNSLSYLSLQAYLQVLSALAQYCDQHALRVHDLLGDEAKLAQYVGTLAPGVVQNLLASLLSFLMTLDPKRDVGFKVIGHDVTVVLLKQYVAIRLQGKQTPPIPTRIYSEIINATATHLKAFVTISNQYGAMLAEASESLTAKRGGRPYSSSSSLIQKYDLDSYFEKNALSKCRRGMSRGLSEAQLLCKVTLHMFSGMRDQEVLSLPFHCTEIEYNRGRAHYLICGTTTKLNNGKPRRTKWVTNKEGYDAVGAAQKIALMIYDYKNSVPRASSESPNAFPLFVSTGYLDINGRRSGPAPDVFQTQNLRLWLTNGLSRLKMAFRPCIEEKDLIELEEIDPHRPWRSEIGMQLGQPWPLSTHQFRRSLALYAQRSGLVSLPSLRRQLQHITKEMSLYYSKGSFYARNFIEDAPFDDKEHMATEWRTAKPLSEALAYLRNVLLTDEELFGGAGAFEQQKKRHGAIVDRADTIQRFKRGEIAYRETAMGGCVNTEQCDQVGLKLLQTKCLEGCKHLIGKLSRVESVIVRQTKLVATLDPTSVEYRMEKSDLTALNHARDQWLALSRKEKQ